MRCIVKAFRRPRGSRGHPPPLKYGDTPWPRADCIRDRNGGPSLSDSVAHASRCPVSQQRTLLAENLGKPSL